jgi:hypothetical protein
LRINLANPTELLEPALLERVLEKMKLSQRPTPDLAGLRALYSGWCRKVPFDNVRKLIHLHRNDPRSLPGDDAADFFESWLRYGTGGTCWAGNGALQVLLGSLGFASARALATMLVAPDVPPNHGTVVVACQEQTYVVDASILHGEPLELAASGLTSVAHPAWGAACSVRDGQAVIRWRPLHKPEGFDCRIDDPDVPTQTFRSLHAQSRPWSPFNYQLYGRLNRGNGVIGTAFGQRVEFDASGKPLQRELDPQERIKFVVEELGIAEEIAAMLPPDAPTPPPPLRPKSAP